MRFPNSFLDEIRERLPISEVVGTRVSWDKKKSNPARGDYWACCPFHGEKTPSFHCENRKGRYHCFGCGVTGDHFRFLVELEGMPFPEVVERLAAQAGLPMPVMDRREQEREEKRATLYDVMEACVRFYEDQLQSAAGAKARAYLRERGLSAQTQKTFRIGYSPDSRNALKEHLAAAGFSREQMETTGMLVAGDDIPVSYDRFRDRIMFPIPDSRERTIAFGGRALRADIPAKYLNSPETDLFHKSNVLFNFARARKAVQTSARVVAAEGYMDVIAMHAAGFDYAVAPLGTALTENQLELLWRLHGEPVMCFDGDQAGQKAAWRAIDLALPGLRPGRSVTFAILPQGKDPDDLLKEEGPGALQQVLDAAVPLADMIWNRETASGDFSTPERKAALEARMREVTAQIRDENVRRHYQQDMAQRLAGMFGQTSSPRRGQERNGPSGRQSGYGGAQKQSARFTASPSLLNSSLVKRSSARMPLREAVLVASVVSHPAILAGHFEDFAILTLSNPHARAVQSAILDILAQWEAEGSDDYGEKLAEAMRSELLRLGQGETLETMEQQLRQNRIWQALPGAGFEDAGDGWKQAFTLHQRANMLTRELKAAEAAFAKEDNEENFARLVDIRNELAQSDTIEALIEGFGLASGRPTRGF
ncbi:MAG: DNA primase [Rhizobiaceae bacterium]